MPCRLLRVPGDPAFAVTVVVVFSLFRKEFHGAEKPVRIARPQGRGQGLIGEFGIEEIGLTSQFLGRVGIGVGDDGEAIEKTAAPVHGRIAGEARFHGVDVLGQVTVALVNRVKARLVPQGREPGGPDMGGDEDIVFVGLQDDLQQVPGIQPQDGAAVRGDIAELSQPVLDLLHRLEVRGQDHMVNLAGLVALLVDGADLRGEHKTNVPVGGPVVTRPRVETPLGLEAEQTRFGRLDFFPKLLGPAGMREIPRAHDRDPLDATPQVHVFRDKILAGGHGVVGMNV